MSRIKEAFIHLLGGHTLTEYNDMREIATEALSNWQNDIRKAAAPEAYV